MDKYADSRIKLESLYEYETVCDSCNKQTIGDQLELLQMSGNLETKFKQLSEKSTELEKLKMKFSLAYNQTRKKLDDLHALFFSTKEEATTQNRKLKDDFMHLLSKIGSIKLEPKKFLVKKNTEFKQVNNKDAQRAFNKYVKYEVRKTFGENILVDLQIRDLDSDLMKQIKDKAFSKYFPKNKNPKDVWNSAMNSLRQVRHQIKKHHAS